MQKELCQTWQPHCSDKTLNQLSDIHWSLDISQTFFREGLHVKTKVSAIVGWTFSTTFLASLLVECYVREMFLLVCERVWLEQSPAAFFKGERQTSLSICTQFSRKFQEFMSENSFTRLLLVTKRMNHITVPRTLIWCVWFKQTQRVKLISQWPWEVFAGISRPSLAVISCFFILSEANNSPAPALCLTHMR